MITRHRKDFLAANVLAVLQSLRLAPDAEVPKEIQDVINLNGGVETVEDRSIHFLDALKRSITVADYVAMPEMKICRKPYVRHVSYIGSISSGVSHSHSIKQTADPSWSESRGQYESNACRHAFRRALGKRFV